MTDEESNVVHHGAYRPEAVLVEGTEWRNNISEVIHWH